MSTYLALNIHIIFSTKYRTQFLTDEFIEQMHKYLAGTVKGLGALPLEVGGVADHVHILLRIKSTHSISNLVQEIKKSSNNWISEHISEFAWQDGYAAIAVSPSDVADLTKYIQNQHEHHHELTFEEERLELLRIAEIEYDPRYMD